MDFLRKMTGTTPSPDAGDKRIREETPTNVETKKPHKVKQQIQLGELLTSLATFSTLGIGMFPTPRDISTTMSHSQGLTEPTPRLTSHSPARNYNSLCRSHSMATRSAAPSRRSLETEAPRISSGRAPLACHLPWH